MKLIPVSERGTIQINSVKDYVRRTVNENTKGIVYFPYGEERFIIKSEDTIDELIPELIKAGYTTEKVLSKTKVPTLKVTW